MTPYHSSALPGYPLRKLLVCISAYAKVYSKTTITKQNVKLILIAGVSKSQAAPIVCISAYANVYSKTTITKQNIKIILIAGVPKSQAAPVYLITAHHLCAFLMYLVR